MAPSDGGTIAAEAVGGGADCAFKNGEVVVEECNTQPCPVQCDGDWTPVGSCSKICGGGEQLMRFTVFKEAAHGGRACDIEGGTQKTVPCNTQECFTNCEGVWSEWGECSAPCGETAGGVMTRKFQVTSPASLRSCADGFVEAKPCNRHKCPVNCVGKWSKWSSCSLKCGGGTRTRRYHIEKGNNVGGDDCPFGDGEAQEEECNANPCPCVGGWGPWSACDGDCDTSVKVRLFSIFKEADPGGRCEAMHGQQQTRSCGDIRVHCDVDCVGEFSEWGECSADCGGGTQRRVYTVNVKSKGKGKKCPKEADAIEERACNTQACPLTAWVSGRHGPRHQAMRRRLSTQIVSRAEGSRGSGHCDYLDNEKQTRPCNEGVHQGLRRGVGQMGSMRGERRGGGMGRRHPNQTLSSRPRRVREVSVPGCRRTDVGGTALRRRVQHKLHRRVGPVGQVFARAAADRWTQCTDRTR